MPIVRNIGGSLIHICSSVVCPLLEPRVRELGVGLGNGLTVHHACRQEQQRTKNRKFLHIFNFIYSLYNSDSQNPILLPNIFAGKKKRRQKYKISWTLGQILYSFCFNKLIIRKIGVLIFVKSMCEESCFQRETNRRLLIKTKVETQNFASLLSVIIEP